MTRRQSELADRVETDIPRSGQRREHTARHPSVSGVRGHTRLRFEHLGMETLEPRVMMAGNDYTSLDALVASERVEGAPLLKLDTKEWIYASALSADGGMLVTGGRPSTLYAYRTEDLAKGDLRPVLALKNTGNSYVQSLAVSPDGKIIVSGGNGQKIVAVDTASGQVLWEKNNLAGNVNRMDFLGSETVLAQVDYGAIQRVNVRTGAMSTAFPEVGDAVWLFDSDQKGETVVGGKKPGLYKSQTGEKIRDFQGIPAGLGDVSISPDGSRVGLGGTDGTLVILESGTGKEIARGNAGRWVGKMKFLTENIVVTISSEGLVMRTIEGNQLVSSRVLATGGDIGSIAFDPNRPEVLVVTNGTKLEVHKTGLKRPAPVVTAKSPSAAPAEKPAAAPQSLENDVAAAPEVKAEAAPVNAKAVDAAITALEGETAFQAEGVLSRRTLEGLDGNEELKKRGKAWLTTGPDPDTGRKTEIRITSPYDQSFLLTPLGVIKLDHPGGVQDKVGFGRILNDGAIVNWSLAAHPRLEFVLYADEGRTVMLDRLVYEGDRANGSFALLSEQRTEAREWETEPSMQVLLTERANVTLAVESPMAGAILELTGGGFMGKKVLKEGFSTPTLTMDGTKPSGTYEVQLLDRPNGTILQRVRVVWDKEGKKLSVSEPLQAFVPKAHVSARGAMRSTDPLDSTRGFQAVFGALSEEVAQVMAVDQAVEVQQQMSQAGGVAVIASGVLDGAQGDAIKNTQRGNLMALAGQADERFQFSLDPDKLWVKFLEVLQGWREENKAQTMERMRIPEREFYYIRGAEFDGYRKFIDGYNEAVGRMLEAGMNAILTARAGGDAAPHLKQLDGIPAEYGVVMDRFSLLRTRLPDRWVILEAAEAILERKAGELTAQQRAAESRIQGEEKKFNNPGNAFAGSGPASAPTNRAAEALATLSRNLDAIRKSEGGIGTVSQRIAGYLKTYGGDLVSSLDVIAKAGMVDAGKVGGVSIGKSGDADVNGAMQDAVRAINEYISANGPGLRVAFLESFAAHGKSAGEAEQAYRWIVGHPAEVAFYHLQYAQEGDSFGETLTSLSGKMASGLVSIRSMSLFAATGEGTTLMDNNPTPYEYLEHAIDLKTPGIRIIGHPVAIGPVGSPFWHSSLLLVPEHPERFANLGLKDEAGKPIFVDGQVWVTLGISGEKEFEFDLANMHVGKEVSYYDRKFDDPIHMPNTFLAEITVSQGLSVDDLIEKIIRADMRYKDDANYDMFPGLVQWKPTPGYNCNSFTTAMLLEAGVPLPPIDKLRIFPGYGEVPLPIPPK